MARLLAIVCGSRTGRTFRASVLTVCEIGLHPVAWAPNILVVTGPSISPSVANSRNALWILPIRLPPAIGATTWSGARQPRSSAISKPIVFDPSA